MRRIVGCTYHRIHRVLDMLCLGFSCDHMLAYSLHVQTQWRVTHNHQIILASRDMYLPFSNNEESNVFDAKCKEFDQFMHGSIVSNCSMSEFGDLQIVFSNDVVFELFIPASVKDEEWRLIDLIRDEHIVFYDV